MSREYDIVDVVYDNIGKLKSRIESDMEYNDKLHQAMKSKDPEATYLYDRIFRLVNNQTNQLVAIQHLREEVSDLRALVRDMRRD